MILSQRSCFLKIRPHAIVGFERVRRYNIHTYIHTPILRFSSVSQKRFDPRHSSNRPRTDFYLIKRYLRRPGKMRHRVAHQIFMGVGLLQGGVLTGKSHIASSSEIAKIACYTLCKTLKCSGTVLEVLLRCLQPKLVLVEDFIRVP